MNETENRTDQKSNPIIDVICGLVALLSIGAMFIPYARDITESSPVEIVSLSAFQFGISSAGGKLLGKDLSVLGIVALAVLALIAILLLIWAIRSFTHHDKAGKIGLIASILNTIVSVGMAVMLSHSREFTAALAVVIVLIGAAGIVLSILQRKSHKTH